MKNIYIIQGAWMLVAAGAYFAGAYLPDSNPASIKPGGVAAGVRRNSPTSGDAPAQSQSGTKAVIGAADRWLDSFRSGDGAITPDRMKAAALAVMRERDPVKFLLNSAMLLNELTPENATAAFDAVKENAGDPDSVRFLSILADAWGKKDGAGALAAFNSLHRREGEMAKKTALSAWAASDPDAAGKWLQEHNSQKDPKADPRQESALTEGMVTGLGRRNVDLALSYLLTLSEGQQGQYVGLLVEQKMKDDVAAGAGWAEALPNAALRTTGMEIAGERFLRRDLDGAMKWAEKISGRPDAHEAVADIANELANRNGAEAVAWVAKLPAGPSQNHAFEDVFENWTHSDPLGASESLNAMTPGSGRDAAIQAFSNTLVKENPMDALTWASAISDPGERVKLQLDLARRWNTRSPSEAQTWISANLSPDLQARALEPQKR